MNLDFKKKTKLSNIVEKIKFQSLQSTLTSTGVNSDQVSRLKLF